MRRQYRIASEWCLLAILVCGAAAAEEATLSGAIPAIEATIRHSGATVAIAFRTLDGRAEWLVRADEPFHAASTMKLPVLIELFSQAHEGKLRLEDTLVVDNEFRSLADGLPYTLDPRDDSDTTLYAAIGNRRTLWQLAELMITVSSNLAANLLIARLGVDHIRRTVQALGARGMEVRRGLEDSRAFELGLNNTTTARALLTLLEAIARGEAVDAESSRRMREILERQTFNDGIPAGLPPGTRVAHKTGDITRIQHDAAIVYAPRPFVLVVLTRGIAEQKESYALIAAVTRQLYSATQ